MVPLTNRLKILPGTRPAHLLLERPTSLTPGLYVAGSDTSAYSLLRAAIAAGDADLLGSRYAERDDGSLVKVVTAGVKRAIGDTRRLRVAANPVIGAGPESFARETETYQDWEIKWWREVVQNSVDAGASRIELSVKEDADGNWRVSARDNGGGMPLEILVDKFLFLGGTTKVGQEGAAGGFGIAKRLILLPWILWEVITGDIHVVGRGMEYHHATAQDPEAIDFFERIGGRPAKESRSGTEVRAIMPPDKHTTEAAALAFIEKSYLPNVKFRVNGELAKAKLKATRLVESVPDKVDVYYKEGKSKTYQIVVRSNGLFMFTGPWVGEIPVVLIAEITAPSIQVLTANRDSFRDRNVERVIGKLGSRIAKDTMSALRAKKGIIRKKYMGGRRFKAEEFRQREARALAMTERLVPTRKGSLDEGTLFNLLKALEQPASEIVVTGPGHGLWESRLKGATQIDAASSAEIMKSTNFLGVNQVEAAVKQLVWEPDFFLVNNIEGFRVPKKFFPESMTPTVLKLLKAWTEICRYVLIQLNCGLPYGVGFYFDRYTAAAYQGGNEDMRFDRGGEHWLLLNPFLDFYERKKIFSPNRVEHVKKLYALAIHEATHMADGVVYHDESFASAMTENMAKCADGFKHVRKIVRAAVRSKGLSLEAAPSTKRRPRTPLSKITKAMLVRRMNLEGTPEARASKKQLLKWALENDQLESLWARVSSDPYPGWDQLRDWIHG